MAVRDSQMGDTHAAYAYKFWNHQAYKGRYENSGQVGYKSVSGVCQYPKL